MVENNKDRKVLLTQISELVGKDIVKYLDLKSRLSFRQTCHLHRELVDNGDFIIEKLMLEVDERFNKILTSDGFDVKFRERKEGTLINEYGQLLQAYVIHWDKWEDATFLILDSNRDQLIKNLEVVMHECESMPTLDGNAEVNLKGNIFERLEYYVQVESLHMQFPGIECLGYVLPYLDQNTIKRITINFGDWELDDDDDEDESSLLDLEVYEEVYQLEQWKSARSFRSRHEVHGEHILHFAHFDFAKFRVICVPPAEKIMEFKEKLLLNPGLNQIRITIKLKPEDFQNINNTIGTYNWVGTRNPVWATFKYPNSQKTLSMCVMDTWIMFKGPCYAEDAEPELFWDRDEEEVAGGENNNDEEHVGEEQEAVVVENGGGQQ